MEVGINVEGGIFWKKLVHNSNKRGVEGGKSKNSINVECGFLFCGGWNFSKSVSVGSMFIGEMRVHKNQLSIVEVVTLSTVYLSGSMRYQRI